MKRLLAVLLVIVSTIVLIGCKGDEKGLYVKGEHTHAIDGTSVVLTVDKNGFITSVNIDVEYEVDGEATTKKALGYDYRMHNGSKDKTDEEYEAFLTENNLLEWFEQAELLEQAVIDNQGIFGIKKDSKVDGVTGVTILVDAYHKVLEEVLEKALRSNQK